MPDFQLPAGTQYALTVNIPENYGGMTASMLQRSRAFVKHAGVDVTILTFEHNPDLDTRRARLRERGAIIDGITVANAWEDLRTWDDEQLKAAAPSFQGPALDGWEPLAQRGDAVDPWKRRLLDGSRELVQVDYLRDDGTVLLSDQAAEPGKRRRRVVLCDTTGQPIGTWSYIFPFYAQWLDSLPRDPVAWIIVDSKSSANMMMRYQRPDVALLHVVRGSHLQSGPGGPAERELVSSRRPVIENLDPWDAVVFLTERQRADIEERFGPRENITVVPNSRNMPASLTRRRRARGRGVMLASLDGRKRIGHAVRAMAKVKQMLPRRRLRLDVWGNGPLQPELQILIDQLKAPVRLRGHSPAAAEQFSTASFSLLTSSAEAFANVLIESMGRGCIPISYDLPYGPSDIITHGVDGFLVPNGDIEALADQIAHVIVMPPKDLSAMRHAAHCRALDFSDERVMELWSALMAKIAAKREAAGA
ncbi:MAG TPA: glycosyltransferase [Aeromicrobium sp.]|nr:glycosyltransferase [Aeromicrobium sp.]